MLIRLIFVRVNAVHTLAGAVDEQSGSPMRVMRLKDQVAESISLKACALKSSVY